MNVYTTVDKKNSTTFAALSEDYLFFFFNFCATKLVKRTYYLARVGPF